MIRYLTAGESHGPALTVVADGIPAGLQVTAEDIDRELIRRRMSVGRGGRGAIEPDSVQILSGVRFGLSLGSPITLQVTNRDFANWTGVMDVGALPEGQAAPDALTRPRPGHADLAGALKMGHDDVRNVLERASARETTCRVAAGALAKSLLRAIGVTIGSHVTRIGDAEAPHGSLPGLEELQALDDSPTRCLDTETAKAMEDVVAQAAAEGESLGGVFEVIVYGVPVGIGNYTQWDLRLDGLLAQAVMSVPAIKGVEIGEAFSIAAMKGSRAADQILPGGDRWTGGYKRSGDRMGGIEGGVSTGAPLVVRAAMKPLPTVRVPIHTVDMSTGQDATPIFERTDVTAVPRAAVVAEAMVALTLASEALRKFGGDSVEEFTANVSSFLSSLSN